MPDASRSQIEALPAAGAGGGEAGATDAAKREKTGIVISLTAKHCGQRWCSALFTRYDAVFVGHHVAF
jgi:hypothetical protein